MISPFFRSVALAGALASAGIGIITQSGVCDRAYRYGVQISNGQVLSANGGSVNLQGRVARNGAVQVSVSAAGFGRLSRDRGTGAWRGQGSSGSCAGTWEAERRG
jgi:hypothetical protein